MDGRTWALLKRHINDTTINKYNPMGYWLLDGPGAGSDRQANEKFYRCVLSRRPLAPLAPLLVPLAPLAPLAPPPPLAPLPAPSTPSTPSTHLGWSLQPRPIHAAQVLPDSADWAQFVFDRRAPSLLL